MICWLCKIFIVKKAIAYIVLFFYILSCICFQLSHTAIISTYAGSNVQGYAGDDEAATAAKLHQANRIFGDTAGNVYLVEAGMDTVRMVKATTGIISKLSGSETLPSASAGDGGPATSATFYTPYGIFVDSIANIFICDRGGGKLRKITVSTGIINTIAGSGATSYGGDGGAATSAGFSWLNAVWGDTTGNIFICDSEVYRVRKISIQGTITTFAGNGVQASGSDGVAATSTSLYYPICGTVDTAGNHYISDYMDHTIRKVSSTGILTRIAGTMVSGYSGDGGAATGAQFNTPLGLFITTSGKLYVADSGNNRIRLITISTGIVTVVAGSGSNGFYGDGGAPTSANLYTPSAVWVNSIGDIYVADSINYVIRKIFVIDPTQSPTFAPTRLPTFSPTCIPTVVPTLIPTRPPTFAPTFTPTVHPTFIPTITPTQLPTIPPTFVPTCAPSRTPTVSPTLSPTFSPTVSPTITPSLIPTASPTMLPTFSPTRSPTFSPTTSPTLIPTYFPTSQPSGQPSRQPSSQPTRQPSCQSSSQPTTHPSFQPSRQPSTQPSKCPTDQPYSKPTSQPSRQPSRQPTMIPSTQPSASPTSQPTTFPSAPPTVQPTGIPTTFPSSQPTNQPSGVPTASPSDQPSTVPTAQPSSYPSAQPSSMPSSIPTGQPSIKPTSIPSSQPSGDPTTQPSSRPSSHPSSCPTIKPTSQPSNTPSKQPTGQPSGQPTSNPTAQPSVVPSSQPSSDPSSAPSSHPSAQPSGQPSQSPSSQPSASPTLQPTTAPTCQPTSKPTSQPSNQPSMLPTSKPSSHPTTQPTTQPSCQPVTLPTVQPSCQPSSKPSTQPSRQPTDQPTFVPTSHPSASPTNQPSCLPSSQPSVLPTNQPTGFPTSQPITEPTLQPSSQPTSSPSAQPSSIPTAQPTVIPTIQPSEEPTRQPTGQPSINPTALPSANPTTQPTQQPSYQPTGIPTARPSPKPTPNPTVFPTPLPSIKPSVAPTTRPTHFPTFSPTVPFSFPALTIRNILTTKTTLRLEVRYPVVNGTLFVLADAARTPVVQDYVRLMGQKLSFTGRNVSQMREVIFDNLIPSTTYTVYFVGEANDVTRVGNILTTTSSWYNQQRFNATTACCRVLTVSASSSQLLENVDYRSLVTISSQYPPSRAFTATLQLLNSTSKPVSNKLVPSSFNIVVASNPISVSSSLSKLVKGSYRVLVVLSGPAATDYEIVYAINATTTTTQGLMLSVQSSSTPLPAPILQSATFSGDGSAVIVVFDKNTDRAGLGVSFSCNRLFTFNCAEASTCRWSGSATVVASVFTADSCLEPGGRIGLISSVKLRSECPTNDGCPSSSAWPVSDVSKRIIVSAVLSDITPPTIVLSWPSVVGSCASLTLDASASTGSGGRSWRNVTMEVIGEESSSGQMVDVSALSVLLSIFRADAVTVVPSSVLSSGVKYTFTLSLCTFLGKCSSSSKVTEVTSTLVPIVTIAGSSTRSMTRGNDLSLFASGNIPACDGISSGGVSRESLIYNWTVSSGSKQLSSVKSTSSNPTRFLLPAYSLSANTIYMVMITVVTPVSKQRASTSVQVIVGQGSVVATIAGSKMQSMRKGSSLVLDAGSSYDEDVGTSSSSDLQYSWSCMQTQPVLSSSCGSVLSMSSLTLSKLTISALSTKDESDVATQLTVTVTDSTKTRSSTAVVSISILPALSAVISLSSNLARVKLNPGDSLKLTGSISAPSELSSNVTWSLDSTTSGLVDLKSVSLTPMSMSYPATSSSALSQKIVYLALPSNVLPAGVTYTFYLTCALSSPGKASSSSISIEVNKEPTPGILSISPSSGGEELSTMFVFSCSRWVDEDLPLTYVFGYLSSSGQQVMLRSRSETAYSSSMLPAGQKTSDLTKQVLVVIAQVYDSYLASSYVDSEVEVKEKTVQLTAVDILNFVQNSSLSSSSSSVDEMKQATALVTYLLNKVDCSKAPNCTSLLRKSCSRTANTCGACLSDLYLGDSGDANSACYLPSSSLPVVTPDAPQKSCVGNCSSHGRCLYTSLKSGESVSICRVGQVDCIASCTCDAGYYGDSCSISAEQLAIRQQAREQVVQSLQTMISVEDATPEAVTSWVSTLTESTASYQELSPTSVSTTLSLTSTIMTALSTSSPSSGSEAALSALSDLMSVVDSTCKVNVVLVDQLVTGIKGSRKLLSTSTSSAVNSTFVSIQNVIQQYMSISSKMLVPGQAPVEKIQDTFRLSVTAVTSSTFDNGCQWIVVVPPKKPADRLLNIEYGTISVFSCPDATSSMLVGVSSLSKGVSPLGPSKFESDINSLSLSNINCDNEKYPTECNHVEVVLVKKDTISNPSSASAAVVSNTTNHVIETVCVAGDTSKHWITCPSQLENIAVQCNGTASVLTSYCPTKTHVTRCQSVSGPDVVGSGCTVKLVTAESIVCSCPIDRGSKRRLGSSNSSSEEDEVKVSYVGVGAATWSNFVTTFKSAKNLNGEDIKQGTQVFATLASFVFVVTLSIIVSHMNDLQQEKQVAVELRRKMITSKVKKSGQVSPMKGQKDHSEAEDDTQDPIDFLTMAEEALPQVLSSKSIWSRIVKEVKSHHRWFGVIFHYSRVFPRVLRIVSLATNIVIMLFIQSITYNLTHGDDGTCKSFVTEEECLQPDSAYSTGRSMCNWQSEDGTCHFVEPDNDLMIMIYVAIFSAIVATPLAVFVDWLIMNVLAAPSMDSAVGNNANGTVPPQAHSDAMTPIVPHSDDQSVVVVSKPKRIHSRLNTFLKDQSTFYELIARREMKAMTEELLRYRKQMTIGERKEFDSVWGLDEQGNFLRGKEGFGLPFVKAQSSVSVEQVIVEELAEVHVLLAEECTHLQQHTMVADSLPIYITDHDRNKRILFAFQRDLLPGISGQILESKDKRDAQHSLSAVWWVWKYLAWGYMIAQNIGMLFYVLLFALSQTQERQNAWVQSFTIWLGMEIMVISTAMVILMHILLPAMLMKDVQSVREKLTQSLEQYHHKLFEQRNDSPDTKDKKKKKKSKNAFEEFNAAKYLFVSYRLANEFPKLTISKVILQYSSPWPRQSYQRVHDVTKTYSKRFAALYRSAMVVAIFFITNLMSVPINIQDMAISLCTTVFVGYMVVLQVQLYRMSPFLVIVPYVLLVGLIYLIIRTMSKKSRKANRDLLQLRDSPLTPDRENKSGDDQYSSNESHSDSDSDTDAGTREGIKDNERLHKPVIEVAAVVPKAKQHINRRQSVQHGIDLLKQANMELQSTDNENVIQTKKEYKRNKKLSIIEKRKKSKSQEPQPTSVVKSSHFDSDESSDIESSSDDSRRRRSTKDNHSVRRELHSDSSNDESLNKNVELNLRPSDMMKDVEIDSDDDGSNDSNFSVSSDSFSSMSSEESI